MNLKITLHNVLLALVYFFVAKFCQYFAIEPGNVTPIWLSSGICFVWVYMMGYKLLPGVFLGAFLGNVTAYIFPIVTEEIVNALLAGLFNGVGDTLCIFIGVYAVKQVIKENELLGDLKTATTFVFVGSLLSSFISALFGVSGLCILGIIPFEAYFNVFITWFVGDAIGILLPVPVFFNLFINRKIKQVNFHFSLIFECVVGLALILGLLFASISTGTHFLIDIPVFILVPLLAVAAFRHPEPVINIIILLIGFFALYFTIFHTSNLAGITLNQKLLFTQLFILSLGSTLLFIIASINRNTALSILMTRRDRLATLGELSASVAHEINNPLAIIATSSEVLKQEYGVHGVGHEVVKKIDTSVIRISKIIRGLKKFAYQDETLSLQVVSAQKLLQDCVDFTLPKAQRHKIKISICELCDTDIYCDELQVQQVIINLLNNAMDAMRNCDKAWIQLSCLVHDDAIELIVKDSGKGISSDVVDRLFNPFYTTKNVGEGTGLGLSISKGIAKHHGGNLSYKLIEGHTAFVLTLPKGAV
jgi:signal transduction histidine kinase